METLTIVAITFFMLCVIVLATIMTSVYLKTKSKATNFGMPTIKLYKAGIKMQQLKPVRIIVPSLPKES
jgi:hypothetical protein